MRHEIPLPVCSFERYRIRAFREDGGISFEPTCLPRAVEATGIVVLIAAAAGYTALAMWMMKQGQGPPWWFHALFIAFIGTNAATVGFMRRFSKRFQGAALSGHDDCIKLRYRCRRGRDTVYRFRDPACFEITLDHNSELPGSWQISTGNGPETRPEKFEDRVEVKFLLRGAVVKRRFPSLSQNWRIVTPSLFMYFKKYDDKANVAAALEAARPLAVAVRECVGIPVEIRLCGGAVLERLEVAQAHKCPVQ